MLGCRSLRTSKDLRSKNSIHGVNESTVVWVSGNQRLGLDSATHWLCQFIFMCVFVFCFYYYRSSLCTLQVFRQHRQTKIKN